MRFSTLTTGLVALVAMLFWGQAIAATAGNHRVMVVYFSQPEAVDLNGADGASGASLLQKNNQQQGSTEYLARLIQQQTGGDIFRLEKDTPYPTDHDALLKYAQDEQRAGTRPALKTPVPDLKDYDIVFVGFPIWWYKMPMMMYGFFEQQQLAGKTVIPFTSHGGSRFADAMPEIKRMQPQANLVTRGLAISRTDVASDSTPRAVTDWLNQLPALK